MNKTKKILTIAVTLTLFSWVIAGFLYVGVLTKSSQVVDLFTEAEKDITKDQTLRTTRAILSQNEDMLSELDQYFVSSDEVVTFIDRLESLEDITGGSVSIISVSSDADPKAKNDFKELLKVRLEITGSWKAVSQSMALLETLPYQMTVHEATIALVSASDKILFGSASSTATRQVTAGEYWKGSFDISVTKLK